MSVISIPGIIRGGQIEKYAEPRRFTATVGAAQAATGGLLVESMAGDRVVRTAQATSMVCVGLALHDAAAAATVTISASGIWMITADGVIGAGNKVITATTNPGRILVAAATPDARSVVGRVISDGTAAALCPCILSL